MQELRFHRNQVQAFGKDHIRLVYDQSSLVDFINRPFEVSNFPKQIDEKKSNFSTDATHYSGRCIEKAV